MARHRLFRNCTKADNLKEKRTVASSMEFWIQAWRNELPALDLSCSLALKCISQESKIGGGHLLPFYYTLPRGGLGAREEKQASMNFNQQSVQGASCPPEGLRKVPFILTPWAEYDQSEQGPAGPQVSRVKTVPTDLLAGLRAHWAWKLVHVVYCCLYYL